MVLITGKQGAGVSTFIRHLKRRFPNHLELNVQYSNFAMSEDSPNFIRIDDSVLQHFIHAGSPKPFIEKVNSGPPGTVAVIEVTYASAWYCQYVRQYNRDGSFMIFDLSSETYRATSEEKMYLINNICKERNIKERTLSHVKRRQIADFEGKYLGFPLLFTLVVENRMFDDPIAYMQKEDAKYMQKNNARSGKIFDSIIDCQSQFYHRHGNTIIYDRWNHFQTPSKKLTPPIIPIIIRPGTNLFLHRPQIALHSR